MDMNKNPQSGFTLIEAMVTVAVGAILVAVAAPQLSSVMKSNSMATTVNRFVHSLNIARSEAMKSDRASICVSTNQTSCTGGTWNQGWIVFTDTNGNCTVDADETVVQAADGLKNIFKVGNVQGITCVTYSGEGFLFPAGSTATFMFCDDRTGTKVGRVITVIRSGRPATGTYGGCPTV